MQSIQQEWITAQDAASILTRNSGHEVSDSYARRLASLGKVEVWQVDRRTKLYEKVSVERYRVKRQSQRI